MGIRRQRQGDGKGECGPASELFQHDIVLFQNGFISMSQHKGVDSGIGRSGIEGQADSAQFGFPGALMLDLLINWPAEGQTDQFATTDLTSCLDQ